MSLAPHRLASQNEVSKQVTDDFRIKVRDWVAYDNKLVSANNAIKRVKEKQLEIGSGIINFMNNHNLQRKEIKISNCRLQYKTIKKTTPLTKKFILSSLTEFLENDSEDVDCKEIVNILYNPRKRMEMCLSQYFNNDQKAIEAVNYIYNQRKCNEVSVLKRKIQRVPVTIDNGPISEDARNTIQSPENTEEEGSGSSDGDVTS
jgi:hypothetical protein